MKKLIFGAAAIAVAAAATPLIAAQTAGAPVMPHQGQPRVAKTVTRAEVAQMVQLHFARLDANRDGFITQAEAQAMRGARRAKVGQNAAPNAERRFARLDANRDGAVTKPEFDAAHQQRAGKHQGMHGGKRGGMGMAGFGGRMFTMADANKDNRVSLQEAVAGAVRHFDTADANRDGTLTSDERRASRAARRASR